MVFGGLSYRYLRSIRIKAHFVEAADDLSNVILEIRRYEKNYLLYESQDDLSENRSYIGQASQMIKGILPDIKTLQIEPDLNLLGVQLTEYAESMEQLAGCKKMAYESCVILEDRVRESGKNLVDLSQQLVRKERELILQSLHSVEQNLILSIAVLIFLEGFFIFFVGAKIVRPLRTIEKTTIRIAQGDFAQISVGHSKDETQRVMEAFNRMISELERRQEQLVQAKKLSSIGILASGIAHQLNNPLNNISTSIQILCEEFGHGDPAFSQHLLNNCNQEIARAQEIVKGLLEFSRKKDFAPRPTALYEIVERSIRLISSQVPSGIEILADVPHNLQLDVDGQRIQEVFLNLLMNAIQAIDATGNITIQARPIDSENQLEWVEIIIADTGAGIDSNDLGRIFDPFFTTKEVGVGTGLGLSIVYGIIEKHRGSIAVESRVGAGSRFIIRLPACAALETVERL
jgi:signal transduction histidine kinase